MALGRSNCLIFALRRWQSGGYLIVRRSRHGWWPHFLWTDSLRGLVVEQYVPEHPIDWLSLPRWKRMFPVHVTLFRGVLQRA